MIFKTVIITAFIWGIPFVVGIFWRSAWGFKLFTSGLMGFGIWAVAWLAYLGWWISQHLCY